MTKTPDHIEIRAVVQRDRWSRNTKPLNEVRKDDIVEVVFSASHHRPHDFKVTRVYWNNERTKEKVMDLILDRRLK